MFDIKNTVQISGKINFVTRTVHNQMFVDIPALLLLNTPFVLSLLYPTCPRCFPLNPPAAIFTRKKMTQLDLLQKYIVQ
jgi:hypothetical protein